MGGTSPDSELLRKVRASDREAFRQLFEKYQPILFRQVLFQTRDQDAAHDIVQETFVRIWERRASLLIAQSLLAYAIKISNNLALDHSRRLRTRERLEPFVPAPSRSEGDDPEETLHLMLLSERFVEAANHKLPERCRTIFLLNRFETKSNQEIADLLGISVRTVEHQINRALKILRRELRPYIETEKDH